MQRCEYCGGGFTTGTQTVWDDKDEAVQLCPYCVQKHAIQCEQCGGYYLKQNHHNIQKLGGVYYCNDCAQQIHQCFNCDEYYNQDDMRLYDNEWYCQDCFREHFGYCQDCDKTYPYDQLIGTYNSRGEQIYVCQGCLSYYTYRCGQCGGTFDLHDPHANFIVTASDDYICQDCQDEYAICQDCGYWYSLNQLTYIDDCYYCQDCVEDHPIQVDPQNEDNSIVYQYGRKIKTKFKKLQDQEDTDQYIGVQLQIKSANQSQEDCLSFCKKASKNKNIIFKADGSIGNTGVQIVSQPCTYNFHKHSMGWQRIFHYMKQFKLTDTSNCGLHFHISRKNFDSDQQKCLDYFVNNATKFLSQIGGRDYSNFTEGEYCHGGPKQQQQYGKNLRNRYEAVNFENSNTVQLRFFKSTAQFSQFRKRLGLVHNICKMAKFFTFDQVKQLQQTDLKYCFHQIIQNIH